MSALPADLWKTLTSTVGLLTVRHPGGVNVMAAEWSYLVNRTPPYAAVSLAPGSASRALVAAAGEFSLTLCAEDQAGLADFAGSFSVDGVDKSTSEQVRLGTPTATTTPWVRGGVVALECELRQVVELPVHMMFIGEVVAAHLPGVPRRPLVKHGGMYGLGPPLRRSAVFVAAEMRAPAVLRVAATAPAGDEDWVIGLRSPAGHDVPLGVHRAGRHGDLLVDVPVPAEVAHGGWRVRVTRGGAEPGWAAVAAPGLTVPDDVESVAQAFS
jgi:flavin reductase (DIM6/NTAB) family NADH-FMN oxidoreductase RutF